MPALGVSLALLVALCLHYPSPVFCYLRSKFRASPNTPPGFVPYAEPLPYSSPFDAAEIVDPLGGLRSAHRALLRLLFTHSVYYPPCKGAAEPVLESVYYWPGQQLTLECRVCHPHLAHNGLVKQWAWLGGAHLTEQLADLKATATHIRSWPWVVLDEEGVQRMPGGDGSNGGSGGGGSVGEERLPNAEGNVGGAEGDGIVLGPERPTMRFVQRDGKLIITAAKADLYGLFRCFDHESKNSVQHAYFLIPQQPLYEMQGRAVHLGECRREQELQADSFFRLDTNHQFRFLPRQLPSNFRHLTHEGGNGSVAVLNLADVDERDLALFPSHLELALHWAPWSECREDGTRTRRGECYIRKQNSSYAYTKRHRRRYTYINPWFMELHSLLEVQGETFRHSGVPLFSGVLAHLMRGDADGPSQCLHYQSLYWDKMRRMLLAELIDDKRGDGLVMKSTNPVDESEVLFVTPCFQWLEKRRFFGWNHFSILSHPWFQSDTRHCTLFDGHYEE